jgi:hypothetical protein
MLADPLSLSLSLSLPLSLSLLLPLPLALSLSLALPPFIAPGSSGLPMLGSFRKRR